MCTNDSPATLPPPVLHDFDPAIEIDLETVDSVRITTLMDNVTDPLLADQGPARRFPLWGGGRQATAMMDNGQFFDTLVAEHGFSALVDVTKDDREYRLLYDTGPSPDGMVENMRRLDIDPRVPAKSSLSWSGVVLRV